MPTTSNTAVKKTPQAATARTKGGSKHDAMLEKFFVDEIRDIYWAEKHLVKTLPKVQKSASAKELQDAIGKHLEETKEHVNRLDQVFELLGMTPRAKKCEAMEGITKEGESVIEDTEDATATRDVGIIMASQKIEHYEIATYGGLVQLAKTLGKDDIAGLLDETLAEEKAADKTLTGIAKNNINYEAAGEDEEDV
ncbi:MAG TPA: ferritin-like domain-containing protein [Chitinophagaceae bacterium]|nr:ferritin-like domain-containing protein [Chitinophagaceae bacterium]